MVNGNYVLYGDKSSESEIIDDHVLHTRSTVERKNKRKCNRTANDLQRTLNLAQLDNETDSVKYEKRIKEPRLLRYVSNADVEENFVTEKFETYDLQATEERPRRYAFQKKTKNPADGSVNYAYSRSSSSCSSPNGNLPTISEHSEQQYGTYRVRPIQSPKIGEIINGFETKHDKFLTKPKDMKFGANVTYKQGSHPDSLYRVPTESGVSGDKFTKMLRILRWPIALIAICIALAVFVYFLMPDNIDGRVVLKNITEFADGPTASESKRYKLKRIENAKKQLQGTKTAEIDFYDNETGDKTDITDSITETILHRKLTVEPIFPTHIAPEVQYGNERADNDKLRIPKILDDTLPNSTKRPHITHKPEKPLEVYIKEAMEVSTDAINRAETVNELANYDEKQTTQRIDANIKTYTPGYKDPSIGTKSFNDNDYTLTEPRTLPEIQELHSRQPPNVDVNFTSGHSKLFGISIEDAEKMMSTTQSSLYNTRVSPTLPTWRSNDETTTKKFPANFEIPQCRSTRLTLCRGILPYDLAGSPATAGGLHVTSLLPQIEYLVATNCSDRVRHFACALMEPECKPPPFPIKKPCKNLCRAITEYCEDFIPQELASLFRCSEYSERNCVAARAPCFDREHRCKDGTCIPRDWLCDGSADCPGGDDEAICATCATNEFSCHGGTCIPQRWLCDGYADCPDGQDESENCDRRTPASELGEEPSGSAPAVAIRKLNILPGPDRARGETDNSKELLVTSDSNNALKRNYTRRPSASRLTPYTRKSIQTGKNEGTNQNEQEPHRKRKPSLKNTTLRPSFNESGEEINVGDLGFFEDFKKTSIAEGAAAQSGDDHKMYRKPSTRTRKPVTTTRLDKTINRLEKVIDGSALLKKAAEAEHLDTVESNTTSIEKEDYIPKHQRTGPGSSHASPCPSGELRCVDGRCITLAQLCDGTIDCTDHADEDNCYT